MICVIPASPTRYCTARRTKLPIRFGQQRCLRDRFLGLWFRLATGSGRGQVLDRWPAGDQVGQWLTTVLSTFRASPDTRSATGRPPGMIKEDLRLRVALHNSGSQNPAR